MADTTLYSFPLPDSPTDNAHFGLTKRELFAAMIYAASFANPNEELWSRIKTEDALAEADRLIKALEA